MIKSAPSFPLRGALTALIFLLLSQSGVRAETDESSAVEPGMTRAEVVARWGDPPSHARSGDTELLHYNRGRELFLQNGRVQYVRSETSRTGRPMSATNLEERLHQLTIRAEGSADFGAWEERDLSTGETIALLAFFVFIMLLMLVTMWRIFTKAGYAGWTSLVPIYNAVVLMWIAGKPGWWVLLMMLPVVNIIIMLLADIGLAHQFDKGTGFGVGLFFLPLIFMPILAFGSAEHVNPREA